MKDSERYFSPQTGETKTGAEWKQVPHYERLELIEVTKTIRRVK